jgi:hypothetical protein
MRADKVATNADASQEDLLDFSENSTADVHESVASVLAASSTPLYTPCLRAEAPSPALPAASLERSLLKTRR